VKMLGEPWVEISTAASLAVIGGVLITAVLMSLAVPKRER